ncbi:MAG TPA: ATP-binding protein [Thermoanaerobaculia bacterium]|nr:ATP-binding protein [Thermoanaerobaculia bacterium]
MARFFNTAGPCNPRDHYMLPPERRLPGVRPLIDEKAYFVVHAPRQSGKTTCCQFLAASLTAEGRYAGLLASCETGRTARDDVERGVDAVILAIDQDARQQLPPELRPAPPGSLASVAAEGRLKEYLTAWAERCPRPVLLFLDEIDSLYGRTLLSVLHQLRSGYRSRPAHFPHSTALIGLRDVRDYEIRDSAEADDPAGREPAPVLGTASPFNIKVESLSLRNFTPEEVAELYAQHTAETGQRFTADAVALAFELTRGQPWLVNALARQAVRQEAPDPATPVTAAHVEAAKEALILRRDTHLDSLVNRLREPRVRRVLEPIVAAEFPEGEIPEDDIEFVKDLGLVVRGPGGLEIANPIYREIIPRALTSVTEDYLPVDRRSYVGADGRLLFDRLLTEFVAFWREHAESFLSRQPYSEAAAQLIFMAYLQRVVNGGGIIDREYAVGSGRIDLAVRWPLPEGGGERFAVELKVWRDGQADPLPKGLEQLSAYLDRLGLAQGTLILFDGRRDAPPLAERTARQEIEHDGRRVTVLRL